MMIPMTMLVLFVPSECILDNRTPTPPMLIVTLFPGCVRRIVKLLFPA